MKHKWESAWYGPLGKRSFYEEKMEWDEYQYIRYQELAHLCCRVYISKDEMGNMYLSRTTTALLRRHVLGKHIDAWVTPKIVPGDIDKFYHTTIFKHNSTLCNRFQRREGGPLPPPETDVSESQLRQLLTTNTDDEASARSGSAESGEQVWNNMALAQEDMVIDLSGSTEDELSVQDQPINRHTHIQDTSKMTSFTSAAIYPTWGRAKLTIYVHDLDGNPNPRFRPREISFQRIRKQESISIGSEIQTIEPIYLDYGCFRAAYESKVRAAGVNVAGLRCIAIRSRATRGSKDTFMEIDDADDFDSAFRNFIEASTRNNTDNTNWPILLVACKKHYDFSYPAIGNTLYSTPLSNNQLRERTISIRTPALNVRDNVRGSRTTRSQNVEAIKAEVYSGDETATPVRTKRIKFGISQ